MSCCMKPEPGSESLESMACQSSQLRQLTSHKQLETALAAVRALVPPLWPLEDYVAVNPCVGLTHERFLDATRGLGMVRDCDLLPAREYLAGCWAEGKLTADDIQAACDESRLEYPEWFPSVSADEMIAWLQMAPKTKARAASRFITVAELVDGEDRASWGSHIVNDVSRYCGTHYDAGQALWSSPWNETSLYHSWRAAASLSWRMDMLGLKGFRVLVANLPENPIEAIREMLDELVVPSEYWQPFLACELFSVAGWASYVRQQSDKSDCGEVSHDDLTGLLAMRLTYDVALARVKGESRSLELWPHSTAWTSGGLAVPASHGRELAYRYTLLMATERAYRRQLCGNLLQQRQSQGLPASKTLQMVFCIDVRSEVLRRQLESVSGEIETFGFAGFFGMPLEYQALDAATSVAQCPVLLKPSIQARETLVGVDAATRKEFAEHQQTLRQQGKLWKYFQSSPGSCFSFVETLGLAYFGKLLTDSLGLTRPSGSQGRAGHDGTPASRVDLSADGHGTGTTSLPRKIDLAEGMLRNLGLTRDQARLVVLCGHGADVVNNPYQAGLDCGACGGHSGEPNARFAARLLNDPEVRAGLAERGIVINPETWFLAGVHNTTTDEIRFCEIADLPASHRDDLQQAEQWIRQAGELTRAERSRRFCGATPEDLLRRSRDWSELRPEWGLAGNAAFIVAPRSRTAGLDLRGRTFLHSYEWQQDPEFKTLELIMTAPMIVANWINLQYYASSVDNRAFGSGNKTLHNVVGQFGVLEGNGGDLMTGLPWQSVHDGERLQHEPLRLLVVIEAPRFAIEQIIAKHKLVQDLVSNHWLSLVVLEGQHAYSGTTTNEWEESKVG